MACIINLNFLVLWIVFFFDTKPVILESIFDSSIRTSDSVCNRFLYLFLVPINNSKKLFFRGVLLNKASIVL